MMLFSKILVAYDGSNLSKQALKRAVELVQEQSHSLHPPRLEIIHVYAVPAFIGSEYAVNGNYIEAAEATIEEAKALVPSTLNVKYTLTRGQPAHTILAHAEEIGCDLIVMGSRGLGKIREFFLGSVSHNVVQQAKVPVLIVK